MKPPDKHLARIWVFLPVFLLLGTTHLTQIAQAEAPTARFCDQEGTLCTCITWSTNQGEYLEIRCPEDDFWSRDGDRGARGTLLGDGQINQVTPRGTPLQDELLTKHEQANQLLSGKLFRPSCRALFDGARLDPRSNHPLFVAQEVVQWRNGENVRDHQGKIPCIRGDVPAWSSCCRHDNVIYVCLRSAQQSDNNYALMQIHELLHVFGQTEDRNSTVGPGDPPSSDDITEIVKQACE